MGEKKVSIVDVAKAAGVSTATVSRVVNRLGGYSEKTEKRVQETIKACGFRPNVNAIGLRTKKSRSVGVIVPDITNEFFAKIVRALDVFFSQYNYSVLICNSNDDPILEEQRVQDMLDKNIDGLIYVSGMENISTLLEKENIPTVFIDRLPHNAEWSVQSDNYQGGYLAGKELCEQGCEKPLLIYDCELPSSIQERKRGFLAALSEFGRSCEGDYLVPCFAGYQETKEMVSKLLDERGCYFDGVFATNDIMALGTMHSVIKAGYSIPEQVKLVGFDNVSISQICRLPMTTIAQNTDQLALAAGETLLKLIRKEHIEKKACIVPVHLEVRGTTRTMNPF